MSSSKTAEIYRSIHHELLVGTALALMLIGGIGGWAALASLESAVIAPATVVVEASRKAIQHETGGFIAEIRVSDGDRVAAGDVLVRLNRTQLAAEINALQKRTFDYSVRRARLIAERDKIESLDLAPALVRQAKDDRELSEIIATQQQLLTSRLALKRSQRKQLNERVSQLSQEIEGLKQIKLATAEELGFLEKELASLDNLRKRQLVSMRRYNDLKRETSEKRGLLGRTEADIAAAEGRINETKFQIAALDVTGRNEVLKELEAVESELQQLTERLTATRDRFSKLEIRASDSGTIHELMFHTIGGVVKPGDTIAQIVPAEATLVVDAQVNTVDRDQIWTGMLARVRFTAFNQRTTPEVTGKIIHISSDQSGGEEGETPFYSVRIKLPPSEIQRLGNVEIKPGMPAEVLMTGQARTVISYLTKPIADQVHRAFRDD